MAALAGTMSGLAVSAAESDESSSSSAAVDQSAQTVAQVDAGVPPALSESIAENSESGTDLKSAAEPLPKYTRDEVSMHYDEGDCWIIIAGKVYDVSSFLDEHPGGVEVIMEYAGLDATSDFEDLPHPAEAYNMLEKYLVGEIK